MGELSWEIAAPGSWEIDAVHFPTPITPYLGPIIVEQFPRGFGAGARRTGLLLSHFDHQIVNGFDYLTPRPVGAPKGAKGPPPRFIFKLLCWLHPELRRRLRTAASVHVTRPWRDDVRVWETEVRPASTRTHLALGAVDVAALDDAALALHMDALHQNAHQQYYWHHHFTVPAMIPVGDFIVRVADWTGLGDGDLMQACRQPRGVATVAHEQYERVLAELAADPAARRLLDGDGSAADMLVALAAAPGAAGAAVRAWMEMTGDRLVTGYDICDLTAREMPELLVRTLRAGLDGVRSGADDKRAAHLARVRDAVPAAHRDEFDALLAEALSISNLREERALVCDFWAFGLTRRAVHEAGRRLARAGKLEQPGHLFDASHAEMLALLRGQPAPAPAELARRHHYRTTTTWESAPPRIGLPPSAPPPLEWMPPAARRMTRATEACVRALFAEPDPRNEPKLVRGINASAGAYEGRARLVLKPADFPRLERGDVLVTRMTTEAYNGIMPLIGAVVTDRGGLLSHTATVAREFGIPAVVGTRDATRIIPDGARVRVDGDRGEARLV